MSSAETPRYIVVEGPIGVGKTSLCRRLADHLGAETLLEQAEENPFLERFYQNPRHTALPTQLFFLFQRVRQLQELRQSDMFAAPTRVADFLMDKDRLFAQITLDDDEFRLYEQVFSSLTLDAPRPDLVIYLQAPVPTLAERVHKRGRKYERLIETAYLQKLSDAYTRYFYYYNESPLLIVNAADIDLVNNQQDFELLLERIKQIRSGRHYFNPVPFPDRRSG
ncbi:MAG: deoxynucleoside kinase [Gammaproteobacteria bacterium]|nr:deoxynucleoside kinase [Gammaproteobacteria bacterium]